MTRTTFLSAAAAISAMLAHASAHAQFQWQYLTSYNPWDSLYAQASGVQGGIPVGVMQTDDGVSHAVIWPSRNTDWIDLNPSGSDAAGVACSFNGTQGGWARFAGKTLAGMWSGTSASWVDLSSPSMSGSSVTGIAAGQQVGSADGHACLWSGTPGSFVDLHRPEYTVTYASGTDGQIQAGGGYTDNQWLDGDAIVWTGSPESARVITPPGALAASAMGVDQGTVFGAVRYPDGGWFRATLWQPDGKVIDLDPHDGSFVGSFVQAMHDGIQVGYYFTGGAGSGLAIWFGSAESVIPIYRGQRSAQALGVWRDGATVYIVGSENSYPFNGVNAFVLTYTIPSTADFDGDGFIDFFDFDAFIRCFEGQGCSRGRIADFNFDGFVDFQDMQDFVDAFEQGV